MAHVALKLECQASWGNGKPARCKGACIIRTGKFNQSRFSHYRARQIGTCSISLKIGPMNRTLGRSVLSLDP